MSTTTETTLETTVQITPQPSRGGRRRACVAVLHGDTAIHLDTVEIDNARSRTAFLAETEERADRLNITLSRDRIEGALLQDALQNQAVGAAAPEQVDNCAILESFGIDVLGEMDDQSIICWVPETGKRWRVKSPANWKVEEMFQAMGQRAVQGLWREQGQPPSGRYRPEALREAVAIAAATAPRLTASRFVGQGVWRHESQILIVNGGEAHLFDGNGFEAVEHPRLGNKIIDFNANAAWSNDLQQEVQQHDAADRYDGIATLAGAPRALELDARSGRRSRGRSGASHSYPGVLDVAAAWFRLSGPATPGRARS